jgi:hypothetical protein
MKELIIPATVFLFFLSCFGCQQLIKGNNYYTEDICMEYYILDENLKTNNIIISQNTNDLISNIEATVKSKAHLLPLVQQVNTIKEITTEFINFTNTIQEKLIQETGGYYSQDYAFSKGIPALYGKPKKITNLVIPERIFLTGDYGNKGSVLAKGPVFEKKLSDLKKKYLNAIETLWNEGGTPQTIFADSSLKINALKELEAQITLPVSSGYDASKHDNKSWSEYTFGGKPVALAYMLLSSFQNKALVNQSAVINFVAEQMGKLNITFDKLDIYSNSVKPYIRLGETFETYITLNAYTSQTRFNVNVGEKQLNVINGKAKYTIIGNSIGKKKYTAKISIQDPLTGEKQVYYKDFFYEVIKSK